MTSAFGGQRSIQLSYGRIGCALSRIPCAWKRLALKTGLGCKRMTGRCGLTSACRSLRLKPERSALRGFLSPDLSPPRRYSGSWPAALSADADELVRFASAGQGEPIQGYLSRPKGARPFSGRRSSAHLPRPAGRSALRSASGSRLGAMSRCSSTTLRPAASRRPAPSTSSQALADAYGALAYLASLPMSTAPGSRRSGFRRAATRRSRSRPVPARPASRPRRLSTLHAPTWPARRSTSRRSSSSARRTR